jgi:hypothetical protein
LIIPGAGTGFGGGGQPILVQRVGFFSPSGWNIEETMTETVWIPGMQVGQSFPQTESKLYWHSIPTAHPDAGPYVLTYTRSWISLSPTGFIIINDPLVMRGWEMR